MAHETGRDRVLKVGKRENDINTDGKEGERQRETERDRETDRQTERKKKPTHTQTL